MPPKKENTKKLEKEKQKIVEDKTFGLKNKNKSKSVQRYIKGVQQQVFQTKKKPDEKKKEEKEKEKLNQQKLLLNSIYQKTEKVKKINETSSTYDPKKSKESQKIDIYTDVRDNKNDKENDTIDQWDINKLNEVINIRHKNINKTDIICKYFLSAVENKVRYVLKKPEPTENEKDEIPLEDIIEEERTQFINNGTAVTLEIFKKWLAEREEKNKLKKEEQKDKTEKKGRTNMLSGKELFTYDPTLFVDDDNAANTNEYDDLFYDDDEQKEDTPEKKNYENGQVDENGKASLSAAVHLAFVPIVLCGGDMSSVASYQ
ncbi:hypothetical protein PCYB_146930 [Plasmodium cynomolgi strain B]|uniref:ZC3H15/TMA46 family C-terminal domain-containing protein n=1 Tax=Plasmodium cynomolgi (strain B) TaxID=1120755 RepID=K6V219_PLACD|nr:hypothetical protein PCYB_146930 [Plasmodium cynomolgi strain B]GAB69265.1 hypothetical protein PCYB_146930 [Plasmodium cynomolgi strain B]